MQYIKVFFKLFLVLFLVLLIVWAIIMGLFQTKPGKDWFVEKSMHVIESHTGYNVEFENVDFVFPLGIRVDHFKLSKQQDTLVTIEEIGGICFSLRLLQGKIICSNLSARGIKVFSASQSESASTSHSFNFPYYLKLEKIDIQDLQFMPKFVESLDLPTEIAQRLDHFSFDLQGKIGLDPKKTSLNTALNLVAHDQTQQLPPLILDVEGQMNQLFVSFKTDQLELPDTNLKVNLAVKAQASFDSWLNFIQDKDTQIKGKVSIFIPEKEVVLKSDYHIYSKKNLSLSNLHFTEPHLDLVGKADITDQGIHEGVFQATAHYLENKILIDGKVAGPFQDLLVQLDANAAQLIIKNQHFEDVHSKVQANIEWDKADGTIDLNFQSNDIPYHLLTDFQWNKQFKTIDFKEFVIEALESQLIGEIKLDTSDFLLEGSMQAQSSELKPFSKLAKLDISGQVDFFLNFTPIYENEHYRQGIDCRLKARDIHSTDLFIKNLLLDSSINSDTLELQATLHLSDLKWKDYFLENGSVKLDCHDPWKEQTGQCELTFQQAGNASMKIESLTAQTSFETNTEAWPLHFIVKGDFEKAWEIETSGFWHVNKDEFKLTLDELQGIIANTPLQFQQPFTFSHTAHRTALENLHLQWGEGQLYGSFSSEDNQFALSLRTNEISSKLFEPFISKLPFETYASLEADLKGDLAAPQGFMKIDFQNLKFKEDYLTKRASLKGKVDLNFSEKGIHLDSQILGISRSPLSIKGILPYKLSLQPFAISQENAPPLDINIEGEGELDAYLPLFMEDSPNLSGQVKMAVEVSGDLQNPLIHGYLDLQDGIYENQETGAIYDHISARLEGQGSQVVLKGLSTTDNHGGNLKVDGLMHLDQKNDFPFDFHIQTSRIYVIHSDYASISASGPLDLIGNIKKSKLTGTLKVDKALVKLEEALPKQIKTVDVNYINVPENYKLPFADKTTKAAIELDIKLNAHEVEIKGNGLKSTWKGEIAINGSSKQPLLFGDLHISQGIYDLKGKIFNLSQGSIHFGGSAEKKTSLYVVASKEIDSLKVEIIVKGPVNKLSFSFRSNPPLSQREILSYILFNKGISDITTGEGDTLNQSFISLNSTEQTEEKQDLLTRLRNNMGIDRLDFTAGEGEDKDFSLQVGKYLWDGVFISLNKSIGAAPDRIAIEAKLKKDFKAEAEVDIGTSSQGKISLKWKKDY